MGMVFWMTGLSGAGKSTLSEAVYALLSQKGYAVAVIDGDRLRSGLCSDLGFQEADRAENNRRAAEMAKMLVEQQIIVLVALISPRKTHREMARSLIGTAFFREVFVDAPFDLCLRRDVKGLYQRALEGEIQRFTGLDSPYEVPDAPDLHIRTDNWSLKYSIEVLHEWIITLIKSKIHEPD
jgi:bifunctional enzyme CysN/CysC